MRPHLIVLSILAAFIATPALAAEPAPIVFFDIATPDAAKSGAFYNKVFGWQFSPDGHFSVPTVTPLPATLRVESAAPGLTERVLYIGVPDVTAALKAVTDNGGKVVFGRMVVPGVVVIGLFTDPQGNRMGLVEIKDGKPVVP